MNNKNRFFQITITKNWIETELGYQTAESHRAVAERLDKKNKRVTNDRFRDIETTGWYYRITEVEKGGKALIFEII